MTGAPSSSSVRRRRVDDGLVVWLAWFSDLYDEDRVAALVMLRFAMAADGFAT